jgi:inosine/xanthosine triphosphatase
MGLKHEIDHWVTSIFGERNPDLIDHLWAVLSLALVPMAWGILSLAFARLRRASSVCLPAGAQYSRIAVGTVNPCKVGAVKATLGKYPEVAGSEPAVVPCAVSSGISEQPLGLEETARGARNRAAAAHTLGLRLEPPAERLLALGIESGLFALDGNHYDVCVVSAFDGTTHHLGLSCAFAIPPAILHHVLEEGRDLSQACNAAGVTSDTRLGEHGGLIGILSDGRLTREAYTVQAIETALFFPVPSLYLPCTFPVPSPGASDRDGPLLRGARRQAGVRRRAAAAERAPSRQEPRLGPGEEVGARPQS